MKVKKIYESTEYDTAEKVSEKFFEECDNFGSEEMNGFAGKIHMIFYFPALDDEELEQIYKCKKYIAYPNFYINHNRNNILLNILLTDAQQKVLDKKLDLERSAKKYNI